MSEIKLKPCPVCGGKAFIMRDAPDGFFMGYSVGCPRYRIGDGIHGIDTFEDAKKKTGYALHGFTTKAEAAEAWNRRAGKQDE